MNAIYKTITLLIGFLAFTPINAVANTVTMNLFPTGGAIQAGDYFDVDVVVNDVFAGAQAGEELLGFGFNAQVSGVGDAQFLGSTVNALFDNISADVGLDAAGLAFPGLDASAVGSVFTLATLHFQALTAGDVSLIAVGDLADFNQGLIFWNQAPMAIDGNLNLSITAVPLPPSAILFSSAGILALVGRRAKQKLTPTVVDTGE